MQSRLEPIGSRHWRTECAHKLPHITRPTATIRITVNPCSAYTGAMHSHRESSHELQIGTGMWKQQMS